MLLVLFLLARRLVHSPFGATLKAIRDNRLRAMAIGIPVRARAGRWSTPSPRRMAGAAGALLAQTTGFASLDVFEFHRSADVMLMLVIGGVGWLYGGVAGAIVFKLLQDVAVGRSRRSTGRSGSACSWWCWCWWGATGCSSPGPGSARKGARP